MKHGFIVIIRPEFMSFCRDACRAATFNHLLFRLAYKCKDQEASAIQEGKILWYASGEQITSEMSDAWGITKVRQEVKTLVAMRLIGQTSNPAWGADRTKHFFFGKEQCATFVRLCEEHEICLVHLDLPPEVKHLIYSSNANDKSIKCTCEQAPPTDETVGANDESINCNSLNHQMQTANSSNAFDGSIKAITKKNSSKKDTKEYTKKERTTPTTSEPTPVTSLSPSSGQSSFSSEEEAKKPIQAVQVVHPQYPFLLLDDPVAPTTLTILLTSKEHESELEDDRRRWIADEVQRDLEARGYIVDWITQREQEQTVVEGVPGLTNEQADFWQRWKALSGCRDDALEKSLPDVVWLAERITTTTDLQSLYDSNAAMLLALSKERGTVYVPPHLKNLVKHYPTWKAALDTKQKQREQQAGKKAVPGTGTVPNWTAARLAGKLDAPPVIYPDAEKPRKPTSITERMGIKQDLAAMRERWNR